ncbi:MAG: hypothetical protein IT210_13640 [Armatimonadetes bacterium]|nr:hypothetical protein [Armatimonadota bacterium]
MTTAVYNLGFIIVIGWLALMYIHYKWQSCTIPRIMITMSYILSIIICAWIIKLPLTHNTILCPFIIFISIILLWYDFEPKGWNIGIPIVLAVVGLVGGWVTEQIRERDVPGYWFMMGSFVGMTLSLLTVGFAIKVIERLKTIEYSKKEE